MTPTKQPMEPGTLKALLGSIAKWRAIVAGTGLDEGARNCPLCQRFLGTCEGCPVDNATEGEACEGYPSPYMDWLGHHRNAHGEYRHPFSIKCAKCIKLAGTELAFLESLLPPDAYPDGKATRKPKGTV